MMKQWFITKEKSRPSSQILKYLYKRLSWLFWPPVKILWSLQAGRKAKSKMPRRLCWLRAPSAGRVCFCGDVRIHSGWGTRVYRQVGKTVVPLYYAPPPHLKLHFHFTSNKNWGAKGPSEATTPEASWELAVVVAQKWSALIFPL